MVRLQGAAHSLLPPTLSKGALQVDTTDAQGAKRLHKVAKLCERSGVRVQNSVFEVLVDAAQLVVLKSELFKIIDHE